MKKKKFILICLCILLSGIYNDCFSQNTNTGLTIGNSNTVGYPKGDYNILIGRDAGIKLTKESYCVIIAEDSIASNIYGYDFIWYVDFRCRYLGDKPELVGYLKAIESFGFVTGGYKVVRARRLKIYKGIMQYVKFN